MNLRTLLLSLVVIFALADTTAYSQVGVRAGINIANQDIDPHIFGDDPSSIVGLNLGVIMEFPLTNQIAIQPELHFIQKGGEESFYGFAGKTTIATTINYIELAVMGKFYVWRNENGPNLYLGITPHLGLGVGGEVEVEDEFMSETMSITFDDDYKVIDYGMGAGIGGVWGSFLLDVRYNLGLADISNFPQFNTSIENRGILFGLGYIF